MTEGLPEAETKLRLVLDYLPCEACLSRPVKDQDLLCSVCRRLDRDVEVTRLNRVLVLLERPSPVAPPVALVAPPIPPPSETHVPAPVEAPPPEAVPMEAAPVEPAPAEPAQAAEPERRGFSMFRRKKGEEAPQEAPPPEPAPVEPPTEERQVVETVETPVPPPAEEVPEPVPEAKPAEAEPSPEKKRGFSLFRRKKADEAPAEAAPAEEEPAFEDNFGYVPGAEGARREPAPEPEEDVFSFTRPAPVQEERPREAVAPLVEELEDDFLYRPPGERDPPPPEPEPAPAWPEEPMEDFTLREEVPVEPEGENPWAPPGQREPLDEEPTRQPEPAQEVYWPEEPAEREPTRPEETFVEMEVLPEDEPEPVRPQPPMETAVEDEIVETEIVEMDVVEEEPQQAPAPAPPPPAREEKPAKRGGFASLFRRRKEETPAAPAAPPEPAEPAPVETTMETVLDESEGWAPPAESSSVAAVKPAVPEGASDLLRLRGFDEAHRRALAAHGIEAIAHLAGHDPNELAERSGLDAATLTPWVHVADLVQDVGVPIDPALALVAAGIEGPRGLRAMEAEAIVDRVAAFGDEGAVQLRDVKRWKRRA